MIYLVLVLNLVAYGLSRNDNFFRKPEDKIDENLNSFFTHEPVEFLEKVELHPHNKYRVEVFLFIFVILGFFIFNILEVYLFNVLYTNHEIEFIQILFMFFISEFILIIGTGLVLNKFNESYANYKKIKHKDVFCAYVLKDSFYIPFVCLEGNASSAMSKTDKTYLKCDSNFVTAFSVEPSKGIRRVSPPYYKIKLNNEYVHVLRSYFYGAESDFLQKITSQLKCIITYKDKLN